MHFELKWCGSGVIFSLHSSTTKCCRSAHPSRTKNHNSIATNNCVKFHRGSNRPVERVLVNRIASHFFQAAAAARATFVQGGGIKCAENWYGWSRDVCVRKLAGEPHNQWRLVISSAGTNYRVEICHLSWPMVNGYMCDNDMHSLSQNVRLVQRQLVDNSLALCLP